MLGCRHIIGANPPPVDSDCGTLDSTGFHPDVLQIARRTTGRILQQYKPEVPLVWLKGEISFLVRAPTLWFKCCNHVADEDLFVYQFSSSVRCYCKSDDPKRWKEPLVNCYSNNPLTFLRDYSLTSHTSRGFGGKGGTGLDWCIRVFSHLGSVYYGSLRGKSLQFNPRDPKTNTTRVQNPAKKKK